MNVEWKKEDYVLIIGSSNMDLIIYSKRFPEPGETVTGGTFHQFLGGKGANQAVASARSGAHTIFISKIGEDMFGDKMISQLREEGIDITRIIRDSEHASGIAFIMVNKSGENLISVAPGANFHLSPEEIRNHSELIGNAKVVVVQMELPINTISEVFKIAMKGQTIKILNPAPLKNIPEGTLKNIDIIIPNEGELLKLNALLGYSDFKHKEEYSFQELERASRNVSSIGIDYLITTIGSKGCLLYERREDIFTHFPAYPVKPIDTVGAGDCFNGVLACKLNQGKDIKEAIQYGISAASIAVTRKGAQASMPLQDEIEKRYKEYKKLIENT